jgi:hypothetical protein
MLCSPYYCIKQVALQIFVSNRAVVLCGLLSVMLLYRKSSGAGVFSGNGAGFEVSRGILLRISCAVPFFVLFLVSIKWARHGFFCLIFQAMLVEAYENERRNNTNYRENEGNGANWSGEAVNIFAQVVPT